MRRQRRRSDNKTIFFKGLAGTLMSALRTTPIAILAGALTILWQEKQMPALFTSTISSTAVLILLLGMGLTFWFNRSRVFFILFILFISALGLISYPVDSIASQWSLYAICSLTSLLLPLNMLFFASLPERGILSVWGKRHLSIIFIQVLFVSGILSARDEAIISQLNGHFLSLPNAMRTPIPDVGVLSFIFVGVLLFTRRYKGQSTFKTAVLGSLAAVALGLHFQTISYAQPLFYTAAGLILILSVIQDSYSMAYLDELTELLTRRALNEELLRLSGNYAIAMLDVDHFKNFNDTYGHDAGDDVLRLVASQIKNVKGGGKAFRYGGEEFTVLFPGKNIDEIMPYLESLREGIANYQFKLRKPDKDKNPRKKLTVTISIGVAETDEKTRTPEEVLKKADAALYRAKDNGRNCTCKEK